MGGMGTDDDVIQSRDGPDEWWTKFDGRGTSN